MIQGSSMTRSHNGMRNGISLVEMMIAVILFGVISVVGFKYSKNYYNTDLSAKKARIASLVEQASQLSNAYDIYQVQMGTSPTLITDLNATNTAILTAIPSPITEIGAAWALDTATDYAASAALDIAFTFAVTDVTPSTSNEDYCAVFNNMIDTSLSVITTDGQSFDTAQNQYTALGDAFCYGAGASMTVVFIKEAN